MYRPELGQWVAGQPRQDDLRFERDTVQRFDGKQWRRQCQVCSRAARPVFCVQHDPATPVSDEGSSFSLLSCRFLDALQAELGIAIVHQHIDDGLVTGGGLEFTVPNTSFAVDGLVSGTNIVVEILGDFWHGNPVVYRAHDVNPRTQKTFGELHRNTFRRFNEIVQAGFCILYVWEQEILMNPSGSRTRLLNTYGQHPLFKDFFEKSHSRVGEMPAVSAGLA
jgi:G:T-mismatch repair DNA endonuclease (very short patch repair protein)